MRYPKAYNNTEFLNSRAARTIRILCEYEEPQDRFRQNGVENTIVLFGSARILPHAVAESRVHQAEEALARSAPEDRDAHEANLVRARTRMKLSRYYEDARVLSRRLTQWSVGRPKRPQYFVCSGGGPGIMEAANRGAADVEGGRSVGLGISLPFEERVNQYVTDELAFEFHYFFMRKYWFVYLAKALVAFPGGFGTFDELTECLTLTQTGKMGKRLPIVLFGSEYWTRVMDFGLMVEWGVISEKDLELFHITDSVDDAYEYLVQALVADEEGTWDVEPVELKETR